MADLESRATLRTLGLEQLFLMRLKDAHEGYVRGWVKSLPHREDVTIRYLL